MSTSTIKTIEEAIGQKKSFEFVHEKALVNVLYTQGWLRDQLKLYLSQYGITLKQYNILRILRGADKPLTTSEIRERMVDKMSDTTRLIDRMIKKEWVQKSICDFDKRLVDIKILDKGLDLLDDIKGIEKKAQDIFSSLDHDEVEKLNYLLDKLRTSVG